MIWHGMTQTCWLERMDRQGLGLETQRPTRRFVSEEWVQLQVRENTSKISLDIESFVFSCLIRSPEGGSCWHCFCWLSSSTFVRVLGFNPVILWVIPLGSRVATTALDIPFRFMVGRRRKGWYPLGLTLLSGKMKAFPESLKWLLQVSDWHGLCPMATQAARNAGKASGSLQGRRR